MRKEICFLALSLFAFGNLALPAFADKAATATSVKIGYFSQGQVRANYPEAAGNDSLKNNAESQLRHDVDTANKQIQQMQQDKKPVEEIQKAARDSQIAINAKTQALTELLRTQNAVARAKIQEAVNAVAKEKGLDLVIDAEGVFAGGKTVLDNGVDITSEVVKKLQPITTPVSAQPADTSRKKATAQPAKAQ